MKHCAGVPSSFNGIMIEREEERQAVDTPDPIEETMVPTSPSLMFVCQFLMLCLNAPTQTPPKLLASLPGTDEPFACMRTWVGPLGLSGHELNT